MAVGHRDPDLKMPPTGKLADEEIAVLVEWVRRGAPDPRPAIAGAVPKTARQRLGNDLPGAPRLVESAADCRNRRRRW